MNQMNYFLLSNINRCLCQKLPLAQMLGTILQLRAKYKEIQTDSDTSNATNTFS